MTLTKQYIKNNSLEDALMRAPELRLLNEETYAWFSRELLVKCRQWLDKESIVSLLYLADLCRKGQLEDLNSNPHAASFYFSKAVLLDGTGQQNELTERLQLVVHHLYQVQHSAASGVPVPEQLLLLENSIQHSIRLQQMLDDGFFSRLRIFLWLEQQKKLVRNGEAASALTSMEGLLSGSLQGDKIPALAANLPFERDYAVCSVYNILFVFAALSPAYKVQFNDFRKELAALPLDTISAGPFNRAWLAAEQAIVQDELETLKESVSCMINYYDQQRQSFMLASGFAALQDQVPAAMAEQFRRFVQEGVPAYILDKIFPAQGSKAGVVSI